MSRAVVLLLLLALGACGGSSGMSGPYVGGAAGGNVREDTRSR
jgi:hypothetical protein